MIKVTSVNARMWSLLGERAVFGKVLADVALLNDKVVGITADQANAGMTNFQKRVPNRFFNVGISEQNAITVASGMASEGYIPFVMFQSAFATTRCTDQVRVCMSYMHKNVKLVGILAGFTFSDCGPTHYSVHDFAFYRTFPNFTVLSPADASETAKMIESLVDYEGPVYLRLDGRTNTPIVYREDYNFEIGKSITLRDGNDVCIIATGSMVAQALKVAPLVENATGLSVKVVNMHTIKPLDFNVVRSVKSSRLIVTMEEHSKYGGLGGAISEIISEEAGYPPLMIIGAKDIHVHAAEYEYVLRQHELMFDQIAERIITKLI